MESSTILLISGIVFVLAIIIFWLRRIEQKASVSGELVEWMKELGKRVEVSTLSVDQKLSRNMELFNNRLDSTSTVIAQVHKSIGEFSEIGRSMKQLQDFLQSPKLRGNIGEHILKELLCQCIPSEMYTLQYTFSNGEKVDAIVKTGQGFIPIDSKFPIENFRKMCEAETELLKESYKKEFIRDVKKHILDIAKKYIVVAEGTIDYALMYIPSESVYYEIIKNAELYDLANSKRILPVSPLSFYAYLKAILVSFEGQRVQSQAKEILMMLQSIKKDYEKSDEAYSILTKHITNTYNQSTQFSRNFMSLGQKINSSHTIPGPVTQEKLI